ncbi:hypothetical protein [Halovulum marinum]|uniref:hypothetical protein n=1 Tax=Halovulum marinum TaxID=2662447 RepID=UPI0012B19E12|nr:hypothetical protein [Halovulum marinum]
MDQTPRRNKEHEAILRMMVYMQGELFRCGLDKEAGIISEVIASIEELRGARTVAADA